jgi:hypothetical protein
MPEVTYTFRGMDNVDDPANIPSDPNSRVPLFHEVALLRNVDMDNQGGVSLRSGRELSVNAAGLHSGWSDPYQKSNVAFFVNGSLLNRIEPDGSITTIKYDMIPGIQVHYCQVNDVTAFSNGQQFSIIEDGVVTPNFYPTAPYKERMVAGKFLTLLNGRLYCLVDNYQAKPCALVCSDTLDVPGWLESMDIRQNIVIELDGDGTMVMPIEADNGGGLFVSSTLETFFLTMKDAVVDGGLQTQVSVAPYAAIPGTALPIKAELLGIKGLQGNCVIWASTRGVCIGGAGGFFMNLSEGKVSYPAGSKGTAFLREKRGLVHYVFAIQGAGDAYNAYETAL